MALDLVERAMAGDLEAFSELVRRRIDQLCGIARLILRVGHGPTPTTRLPDGRTVGDFETTLAAMPCALELVHTGRSPRTLDLDGVLGDGQQGLMMGGLSLEHVARWALGPRRTVADMS